jgi:signal transduction histidine kinase
MRFWKTNSNQLNQNKTSVPGRWVFYVIAATGVLISWFLWYAFILQTNANLAHIIQLQTDHIANDVRIQLELRISALKHMAKHLESDQAPSYNNWQDVVEYVDAYGGFKAVAWLSPSYEVNQMDSENSDTKLLYLNAIQTYLQTITNISNQKQVWLSPPIRIASDQEGILVVVPLFNAQDQSLGYLVSLLNVKYILNIQLNQMDYAITIYYDSHRIFQSQVETVSNRYQPFISDLSLYDTDWRIYVQPSALFISSITSNISSIALVLGICIAILFAITAYLALLSRSRAKSLNQININLTKEIAERMQAEDTKLRLEKALQQGQKLQAIGTLAGGIAHDFNNILYAIIGYVEMARDDVGRDSLVFKNLGNVLEASQRGRELISRILAFGRRQQHHEFKAIPLKSTIESVLELLQPTIPASITINYVCDINNDYKILGNHTQLHQIMVNLINNAVDAMDGEGVVDIQVSHVAANHELLRQFPHVAKADYCKIDVSDTGHGMEPATIERIFEPFFTTKEVGKGTGLGLATVHAIIEEHQGKILVKSQLGHGSVFTIFLPTYKGVKNG